MKKILFLFILSLATTGVFAQQENHYTMFMYNKLMYNAAFAGAREVPTVTALYRNQWISVNGAPTSALLNFDTPLGKTRASIGGQVSNHRIGVQNNLFANLAYSYALIKTPSTSLRLGLNGTFQNYQYDFSNPDLYIKDGISSDLAISSTNLQKFKKGNFGAGAYFDHKGFYAGFSVPNLFKGALGDATANSATQLQHYYLMIGALIPLSSSIDIKPSIATRFVTNASLSFDTNVMFIFNKNFHAGVSYRIDSQVKSESTDFLLFFQPLGQLGFGVAYDLTVSGLKGNGNKGTIEALVRYDLRNANGVNGKFDNPRFFF